MKTILLIGLGRFGRHVAMKLHELNHQVMAVDQDEEKVNRILPYVTSAQIGDSTNEEFLASLGVRNFDVCIVAIGDNFQSSLETASLLKEAGAKKVVARAARDIQAKFLLRNGADEVVYPERQIAVWTAIRYSSDNISDYIALGDDHAIFEIQVPDNWVGKTIGQLEKAGWTNTYSTASGCKSHFPCKNSKEPPRMGRLFLSAGNKKPEPHCALQCVPGLKTH